MFAVERLEDLQQLLGPNAERDPDLQGIYWLEPADLAAISRRFGVPFDAGDREVALLSWHSIREIPYLVHTGYELPLLLDGRKRLARFHHEYPPHDHGGEEQFDHFEVQGLLHKEVDIEPFGKPHRHASGHVWDGVRTAWYTSSEPAEVEHSSFRALPSLDRSLPVISSFEDDLTDDERRQLGSTLIRFRVKAGLFLKLTANPQEREHILRADHIKDVNGLLVDKIEVLTASQ